MKSVEESTLSSLNHLAGHQHTMENTFLEHGSVMLC